MATINGNFTDADGNLVNIADLLRGVTSSPENKDHMSPISGWFYDGEGNRVNIIDIIRSADLTDVKGIIINSGTPITPNKDGYLDVTNHAVKSAEQLISDKRTVDKLPYKYRASASGKSDRAYDMIVGGTVCFNQLAKLSADGWTATRCSMSINGTTITMTTTSGSSLKFIQIPIIQNHKYFMTAIMSAPEGQSIMYGDYRGTESIYSKRLGVHGGTTERVQLIFNAAYEESKFRILFGTGAPTDISGTIDKPQLFDLTQMFGTAIADHIYNLERANAGTGVSLFRQLFPDDYYAYNAGELVSVAGLSAKEVVGFNLFDEIFELGGISTSTGLDISSTTTKRSKNYIHIFPNTNFYLKSVGTLGVRYYNSSKTFISGTSVGKDHEFISPSDAYYLRVTTASVAAADYPICINISSDKNGQYEPYHKTVYPLNSTLTLNGVPVLNDGKIEFDGDTYEADGKVTRRYRRINLGLYSWAYTNGYFKTTPQTPCKKPASTSSVPNIMMSGSRYRLESETHIVNELESYDKCYGVNSSGQIIISDSDYTDTTAFKSAMSNVYLVYELEKPTTETATPYPSPQIISQYGTEEYISETVCPVGHITEYPDNLRAKLDGLPWDFSMIAPVETAYTATRNYTVGQLLIVDNTLYKVTSNIAKGGTITAGTNVVATTLSEVISALA